MQALPLLAIILWALLLSPADAKAWYEHRYLIPLLIADEALTVKEKQALSAPILPLCGPAEAAALSHAASVLQLNPTGKFSPAAPDACKGARPTTGAEILTSGATDDPDRGMDENLPDAFDPRGERESLGGKAGPGSKTFRHVFFRHFSYFSPLRTLHFPTRELGEGRMRVQVMAKHARQLHHQGQPEKFMSFRVLAWAFHYIQDLGQPFHSAAIPSMAMVPWYALWTWPPSKGFSDLRSETERSVTNFHWAIEGYVRYRFQTAGDNSLAECLTKPAQFATIDMDAAYTEPFQLADAVAQASSDLGPELGSAAVKFFGSGLLDKGRDFAKGAAQPSYPELAIRPDLTKERAALHDAVCKSLANGAWASRWLVRYVTGDQASLK